MKISEIERIEKKLSARPFSKPAFILRKGSRFVISLFFSVIFRIYEIVLSFLVLSTIGTVIFVVLLIRRIFTGLPVFSGEDVMGIRGRRLHINYFSCRPPFIRNIPLFYYVIANKMSVTGVSIRRYDSYMRSPGDAYLYNSKPGIFTLWYVRKASKITHGGQLNTEWEYIFKRSLIGDILIIFKSVPALFYYVDPSNCREKVNIFGLYFNNLTMKQAIGIIDSSISEHLKKKIYFVNPDCLNKIFNDNSYFEVLNRADYVFPDGIGIGIACKILKDPLLENINGTDMFPYLCELSRNRRYSIYFLGGRPGVAEKMREKLLEQYPDIRIAGVHDGFFDREKDTERIIRDINNSGADILLVAFGAPLQEKWIDSYSPKLNPWIQMGVGGLFDFYSGNIRRAPKWMRETGIEWIYRIMQEPGRMWRRYIIGNPLFVYRVLKWKFTKNKTEMQ